MRLFITLAAILSMIIGMAFWLNDSLQEASNDLSRQINVISLSIARQDWEEAAPQSKRLEQMWEEKARWWPAFLDHQEIDNIEFSLARAKEYIISRDKALSLGQLAELKVMIEHIPSKEAVNLENVF